ncbi:MULTISPECIES: hypothetical protein [Paenibacillus]|uniref:Uncharacterized protein n=1 Tax=Paenibacillus violae TaxID=3077234 RepID=A0ABU3RIR2_9BACL|nr:MULTISPECIES: hypothetical protein [Paenibacillus]MDU0204178.1 hypothetical protein [Paenibacillus sp. PFR10]MEC0266529.1 hypothetical protein [Paenibacillus anseongense]
MSEQLEILEELIGEKMLKVLPPLRAKKEILFDDFLELFIYLEKTKDLLSGQNVISRSLSYKLFYLYFEVSKQFSFIHDSTQILELQQKLFKAVISTLNDNFFIDSTPKEERLK